MSVDNFQRACDWLGDATTDPSISTPIFRGCTQGASREMCSFGAWQHLLDGSVLPRIFSASAPLWNLPAPEPRGRVSCCALLLPDCKPAGPLRIDKSGRVSVLRENPRGLKRTPVENSERECVSFGRKQLQDAALVKHYLSREGRTLHSLAFVKVHPAPRMMLAGTEAWFEDSDPFTAHCLQQPPKHG